MRKILLLAAGMALAGLMTGCASGGARAPKNTDKFNVEQSAKFVLLDSRTQHSVTCAGLQEGTTADGRLKVVATLRNRENRRIEVQVNCVFKDAQDFAVDETPFRTVILDENAMQAVTFEAFNKRALRYTVRVREAR
jgi:hypothetical protein